MDDRRLGVIFFGDDRRLPFGNLATFQGRHVCTFEGYCFSYSAIWDHEINPLKFKHLFESNEYL